MFGPLLKSLQTMPIFPELSIPAPYEIACIANCALKSLGIKSVVQLYESDCPTIIVLRIVIVLFEIV